MGFFSKKVDVTLIDDRSDTVMGVSKLAPDALPEAFFASTTLHLGNKDWSVVSADPMTRGEYVKSGRLRIRLRPIEMMDPKELLFSLPTINDGLPASDGPEADGTEVALLEDDWRQCELVSIAFEALVEREFAAIRAIHEQERVGPGFRKLHVRSAIPDPIVSETIAPGALDEFVGSRRRQPLRFHGAGRRVSSAFAVSLAEGESVYTMSGLSGVHVIGLFPGRPVELAGVLNFAQRNGLLIVDWCACEAIRPD